VHCQNNLRLLSTDSVFRVYQDDKALNAFPQAEVLINNILKDTLYLKIEFEGHTKTGVTFYLLEKGRPVRGKEFDYRISRHNNKLSAAFSGIYDIDKIHDPIVPKKPAVDTSRKYLNSRLGHFCELKNGKPEYYKNIPKTGICETAMPEIYLNFIRLLMDKAHLPDDKFVIAENVFRNNCFSTIQMAEVLKYVVYELDKLKLIKLGYHHVCDKQNKKDLEKCFRFESSILELNNFFRIPADEIEQTAADCTVPSSAESVNTFASGLGALSNDTKRLEAFKTTYSNYCYSVPQSILILQKFIHDREKMTVARMLYNRCTEKDSFIKVAETFSYNQSASELKDFIEKQK
jgi:hypothetical protein